MPLQQAPVDRGRRAGHSDGALEDLAGGNRHRQPYNFLEQAECVLHPYSFDRSIVCVPGKAGLLVLETQRSEDRVPLFDRNTFAGELQCIRTVLTPEDIPDDKGICPRRPTQCGLPIRHELLSIRFRIEIDAVSVEDYLQNSRNQLP